MYMLQKLAVASAIGVFVLCSCDILRVSPFEVTSWMPDDGFHRDIDLVSATLSHESDASGVEHAFSFTRNGASGRCVFTWQDKTMFFTPALKFEANSGYEINLSIDAHDTQGFSFDRKFEARFTTRHPEERPVFVSIQPEDSGIITGEWEPVKIMFSRPVPLLSFVNSISVTPSKSGSWRLENETAGVSIPLDPWKNGASYKITIGVDFKNTFDLSFGKEETSRFSIGSDNTPPTITAIYAVTPPFPPDDSVRESVLVPDDTTAAISWTENAGEESNSRLRLVFSEPVDVSSVKSSVAVEPQTALVMDVESDYAETVEFSFAKSPGSKSLFFSITAGNIGVETQVYRVYANDVHSKPSKLIGIRLPLAPMPAMRISVPPSSRLLANRDSSSRLSYSLMK
ncbi:MAG: hypothetical protein LBD58_01910 [Treponema sp.]|jgi:hypothetical protein|nr:hypothetical protein [Treponema sp.]